MIDDPMAIGGEASVLETPVLDPILAPEDPSLENLPTVDDVENAMIRYLNAGHELAIGMIQPDKRKWAQFKLMKEERGFYQDQSDPLVRMGVHFPALAKLIDVMKANLLAECIPDASEMNFFEFQDERGYFDEYVKRMQFLVRKKFQTMKPGAARDFLGVLDMLFDDMLTLGNCVSIITHEIIQGDADGDGVVQGPTVQYMDPFNWWPWDWDVENADQTQHSFFAPLDVYALKAGGYVNLEKALEEETPNEDQRRDPDADYLYYNNNSMDGWWDIRSYGKTDLYHRKIYFGIFPGEDLRKNNGIGEDVDDETLMTILATKFCPEDKDPVAWVEKGMRSRWWHQEWIGNTLICCEPYPVDLPMGHGPVIHQTLIKRNGRLLGLGLYDRGAWDERLLNFYRRAEIHITKLAANPPWWYVEGSISKAYLQQQQSQYPQLVPGKPIPIIPGIVAQGQKPMEPFPYNIQAVPECREQERAHEDSMRELTGVTSSLEGDSQGGTATQSANNLQQSGKITGYYGENADGMVKRMVAGCYVIVTQVLSMEAEGYVEYVPADLDEQGLVMLDIKPTDAVPLRFIKIVMTGASAPGNRMNQAQAFSEFAQTWLPTGVIDPIEGAKVHAQLLGINGANRLIVSPDVLMMRGMMARQQAFGPQGAAEFTPSKEMAMMGAGAGIGAPPAGPPMPPQVGNNSMMAGAA